MICLLIERARPNDDGAPSRGVFKSKAICGAAALWILALGLPACVAEDGDSSPGDAVIGSTPLDGGAMSDATTPLASDGALMEGSTSAAPDAAVDGAVVARDSGTIGGGTGADAAADAAADSGPRPGEAGTPANAKPSAGCGKSGRPAGGRVSVQGDHNYTFPESYDGMRPFPLLIGFHAASNPIEQIENLTKGSDFEKQYVRAFPKSNGSAWGYDADIAKVRAMYNDVMANYCIDSSRVFATGHSSGAQMIVQILTPAHKADADLLNFRAVAPVAASRYGTVSRAIPVMYIQAMMDSQRGGSNGADVVKEFVTANGCGTSTKPLAGPTCMSSGKTVNDGCVQYDSCTARTVWCSHDDPNYSNTYHGVPCFAVKAMFDFFAALP